MTILRAPGIASANVETIARLYDPGYVRRVETLGGDAPVQVCIETRMLGDQAGTGIATYARMLARCLAGAGAVPVLLDDGSAHGAIEQTRVRRWLAATRNRPRNAVAYAALVAGIEQRDAEQRDAEEDRGSSSGARGHADAPIAAGDPAMADPAIWIVSDLFREAQSFFNLHGRLLPITFARPPAVMHWTYPVPIFAVGAKNIYTIHDLIPLTHPALTPIRGARHRRILTRVVERAHTLVTVSETMQRLVTTELGVSPAAVVNTFQAVDAPLQGDPALPAGLRSGRYFLFCGRVEPRKNLARLAEAHRRSGTGLPLVIVGPETPGEAALERTLHGFPLVRRISWVPRPELLGLIRAARALLFPSLAEGFGLPIVEAMTLGCPVLTSHDGAPAEIAGEAALLVDPASVEDLAHAIGRLGTDDHLCARLRATGFARGRFFAPDAYARRLRALYAGALAAPLRADSGL